MADQKNLPVKLFSKRGSQDERFTEGGGGTTLPPWVQTEAQLTAKVEEFRDALQETERSIASRLPERQFIPALIKVTINQRAIAKTHRTEVSKVFNRKRENNFVGLSDDLDFLVKVENTDHLKSILKTFERPMAHQVGLSAIEEIEPYRPDIQISENADAFKIKLINYQDPLLNLRVEAAFERFLEINQITNYQKTSYSPGLTIFRVDRHTSTNLDSLLDFEAIYSVTPMPTFEVNYDGLEEEGGPVIKVPDENVDYITIGVLDSGIARTSHIAPWLDDRRFSAYLEEDIDPTHGTFVTGIILYGDELEGTNWVSPDAFKIIDATVFPKYKIFEDELIDNIRRAIRMFPDVKLWNFSGGGSDDCVDHDFSDFGKALDELQKENDILICKSAGNCLNFMNDLPPRRIPKSADSLRSLVVGSIAHAKGVHDMADADNPSPFTRIGFGPNKCIKPDVTHYGGNAGRNLTGARSITGVKSFTPSGLLTSLSGTSFSTPRISALVGGINNRINQEFDPLLSKALVIHSANYPTSVTLDQTERLRYMGYGLPSSVDDILYNSPYEITLIMSDVIEKGRYIDIMDFPYPDNLVDENGIFYGEIIATLVTNPYLDGSQGPEYCQTDISLSFGTYEAIKQRDMTVSTILNPIGREDPQNLLRGSLYKAAHRNGKSKGSFATERQLRDESLKYHSVKKYAINLDELTEANRLRALQSPKNWFVQLKGLVNFAADQDTVNAAELAQDFCLIMTIRDPHQQKDIYTAVTRSLDLNGFPHSNIQLRGENRIDLRG